MATRSRKRVDHAEASALTAMPGDSLDEATLYARNWAFIPAGVQAAIRDCVVFAAGTGLASNVLELACRTGFTRFIVADGDTVDLSNLNRQAFGYAHVGQNKAEATAEVLRCIRPDVAVEIVPHFLDESSCLAPMARANIVLNSLDFDHPALFALNRAAQAANIPVLQPVNLGWGGALLIFTAESPSLEDFIGFKLGVDSSHDVLPRFIAQVVRSLPLGLPTYLEPIFQQFLANHNNREAWPFDPQLGVATQVTAALAVRAMVALVAHAPVQVVPSIAHCDIRVLLEPPLAGIQSATTAILGKAPKEASSARSNT